MVSLSALSFVLLLHVLTANAKFCAKCDGVVSPDRCVNYSKCSDHEECYIEEKSAFGIKTYNLGCLSSTICRHLTPYLFGRSVNKRQIDSCVQCCSSNGCNTGLCKDNMFPLTTDGYLSGSTNVWQNFTTTTTLPPTSYGGKISSSSFAPNVYNVTSTMNSSLDNGVNCDFEYGMCQWYQDHYDNFDWTRENGLTATVGTGPYHDHTFQTSKGHYLYIESSDPRRPGDKARIIYPSLPATDAGCLNFWYSMYGESIGTLSVMVNNNMVWTRNGNQGNYWFRADVNIKENTYFNVSIQGTVGTGYRGDIAIDDISYRLGKC